MYGIVLNLTQHDRLTDEQKSDGARNVEPEYMDDLKSSLTFDEIPSRDDVMDRAEAIVEIACQHRGIWTHDDMEHYVMIGGAPWLMPPLAALLHEEGFTPLYAFSRREVVENDDGRKVSVFRHLGFIPA